MTDASAAPNGFRPRLQAFVARAFEAVDVPPRDAASIAELMTRADLGGADGHGVFRLPQYIRRIKGGAVNSSRHSASSAKPRPWRSSTATTAWAIWSCACARKGDRKGDDARRGVGRRKWSNHAGPASLYASMPLAHDMIGLYLAVGSANHLPPGAGSTCCCRPIRWQSACRRERAAVVLDMATTVAAYGKVKTTAQRGEMMPEGWMIDREGKPLTDPKRAAEGLLFPSAATKATASR
jgi:LDH2 family malate/lactate/ureidoglycolate dehydrogenase